MIIYAYFDTFLEKIKINNNIHLSYNNIIFYKLSPFFYSKNCSTGYIYNSIKDFPKERYNTYAKSCNSNLYTKYPSATYNGLLLGNMCCL